MKAGLFYFDQGTVVNPVTLVPFGATALPCFMSQHSSVTHRSFGTISRNGNTVKRQICLTSMKIVLPSWTPTPAPKGPEDGEGRLQEPRDQPLRICTGMFISALSARVAK